MQPKPTNTTPPTLDKIRELTAGSHYTWTEYNFSLVIMRTEARSYTGIHGKKIGQSFGYYLTAKSPQARRSRWSLGDLLYRGEDEEYVLKALDAWRQAQEQKIAARQARQARKAQARKNFENPYKVGQFLYSHWGYEQTNREFYEILEVRKTTLVVRQVAQERERNSHDSGTCRPVAGKFVDLQKIARIQIQENNHYIVSPDHPRSSHLYLWNGETIYFSDGY